MLLISLTGSAYAKNCGGSTNCECGDTLTSSHVMDYDLEDCTGVGIVISGSQITLDCSGHTIDGDNSRRIWAHGISLVSSYDALIKNCVVKEFGTGVYSGEHALNTILINSTVSSNVNGIYLDDYGMDLINNTVSLNVNGIYLDDSGGNEIINNIVNSNEVGMYLTDNSQCNDLFNNTVNSNVMGIFLNNSGYNLLRNNTISGNSYNFNINGGDNYLDDYSQDIDSSNTVDGKPIYYWTDEVNGPNNCKNAEIPDDAGFVALVFCDNVTVKNLDLNKNSHGVLVIHTNNSGILNNTISFNKQGIYLDELSRNNNITGNFIISNKDFGIHLRSSSGIGVVNNTINSNNETGVYLWSSSGINIVNNTINSNDNHGIHLMYSSNNNITGNTINSSGGSGIHIHSESTLNMLNDNEISGNKYGVFFRYDGYLNDLNSNTVCSNTVKDIYDLGSNSDGMLDDNNTCNTTHNWNDYEGITCTHKCGSQQEEYDSDKFVCYYVDCITRQCSAFGYSQVYNPIMVQDWEYMIESYKCFLGLNRNCNHVTY